MDAIATNVAIVVEAAVVVIATNAVDAIAIASASVATKIVVTKIVATKTSAAIKANVRPASAMRKAVVIANPNATVADAVVTTIVVANVIRPMRNRRRTHRRPLQILHRVRRQVRR